MYTDGKGIVGGVLATIEGVTVTTSYSQAMESLPAIIYAEVVNTKACNGAEKRTSLAYDIHIYSKYSTTNIARQVNEKMSQLGFYRGTCLDVDDPSGLRHKNMKYTGVYDANTNRIYER